MKIMYRSRHAVSRCQQRSIPPVVLEWLDEFGERQHDGHGAVRIFFSHQSVRRMEQRLGGQIVGQVSKYLSAYCVLSNDGGEIITAGWRTGRIRRR
ncbi:MAG: hypothetical protein IPJ98_20720 [Bryobacterales bacterium]|nr:hypothetical protein [Bryobacterales bacterium]